MPQGSSCRRATCGRSVDREFYRTYTNARDSPSCSQRAPMPPWSKLDFFQGEGACRMNELLRVYLVIPVLMHIFSRALWISSQRHFQGQKSQTLSYMSDWQGV